ncbi:MAG: hypothetical protein V1898_03315 [Patescibacteria group bacterium]
MAKAKPALSRRTRERLAAKDAERRAAQQVPPQHDKALPDMVDLRKLDVHPGIRNELLKIGSDLLRFEPAARRAKLEHNEMAFLGILEGGGILGEQFIADIKKLGDALISAVDNDLKAMDNPRDKNAGREIISQFNRRLNELLQAVSGMPLLKMSLREAGFFAFQKEALDTILNKQDPHQLAAVKSSKHNSYRSIVEAMEMGFALELTRIIKRAPDDGAEVQAMIEKYRDIRFAPTGQGDQLHYRAVDIKPSKAHPDSKPIVTIVMGVMEKQSALSMVRVEIATEDIKILCELSRLTGELCPVHACVYNLRELLGTNYDILRDIVIRMVDRQYKEGFLKPVEQPEKIVDQTKSQEMPALDPRVFSIALRRCGANLVMENGSLYWRLDSRRVPALSEDTATWVFWQEIEQTLMIFNIALETFVSYLPSQLRQEYLSRMQRKNTA